MNKSYKSITKITLLKKIKDKKELSDISDSLVRDILKEYIEKTKTKIEHLTPYEIKIVVKEVRAQLRLYSGRFQKSTKDRKKLLKENRINELLKTHSSTKERLQIYPYLKEFIKKLKVKSILDLACGLNPIALAEKKYTYHASDIKKEELKIIKSFFKKERIRGRIFIHDIRKSSSTLPKADLCLLFKVLDIIEKKGHKISEKIITSFNCKYVLISFSTKKLSGKPMNQPERKWLERLLKRHNLKYEKIRKHNEIFYFITNPQKL